MKREIKFRAWDDLNKVMHYNVSFSNRVWFIGQVFTDTCEILGCEPMIKPMQFTGLTDKNGKEIYEGDVIQYDFLPEGGDQRDEVIYEGRSFCLKNGGNNYMPYSECMEVIGNIYENPDLLTT